MRPSVRDGFRAFTARFEGVTTWMYLDVRGLVTTGVGNLIGRPQDACALPWVRTDGTPASSAEVAAAWQTIKGAQSMKMAGGGAFARLTAIRLSTQAVDDLVHTRMDVDWSYLLGRFPALESWPADAQMGLLSIAWAAGPGWHAPKFDAAARALDFATCAGKPGDAAKDPTCRGEAWLNDAGNPGLRPRNLANKGLFQAATLTAQPDVLCAA